MTTMEEEMLDSGSSSKINIDDITELGAVDQSEIVSNKFLLKN